MTTATPAKATTVADRIEAPWLDDPSVRSVVDVLGADTVRFVGGVVRDTLDGRPVKDIDIATTWLPEQAMKRLEAAGLKVIPTGLQHGTITVLAGGEPLEITTLRRDVATDGRHAEVAFTDDWHVDAARRDFTMNALYAAPNGSLFDPFGGVADLKAGCVRFIGDASERIREDALRIMRFFRFHAGYGRGQPDPDGLRAVSARLPMLSSLSAERVRDELFKLLAYEAPTATLQVMEDVGLWHFTPMKHLDLARFRRLRVGEKALGWQSGALARFAILSGRTADELPSLCRAFKLSNSEQARAVRIAGALAAPAPASGQDIRQLVYRHGAEAVMALVMVSQPVREDWADIVLSWRVPVLPLKGRDLIAQGVEPGPDVSRLLKEMEATWVASDFSLGRDALLASLARPLT